jgi:hypothetical protein
MQENPQAWPSRGPVPGGIGPTAGVPRGPTRSTLQDIAMRLIHFLQLAFALAAAAAGIWLTPVVAKEGHTAAEASAMNKWGAAQLKADGTDKSTADIGDRPVRSPDRRGTVRTAPKERR